MASYVTALLYKQLHYIPFVGALGVDHSKVDSRMPRSLTIDLDRNQLKTSTDRNLAGQVTPPPSDDRSAYAQFVDKLVDTTWKTGISQQQQQQQLINRQSIMQGIKLVGIAADEFDSGNEAIGLDVYLSGLDKIIMSLPNLKDEKTKSALKDKLLSLEDRVGIVSKFQLEINDNSAVSITSNSSHKDLPNKFALLSQMLTPTWITTILNTQQGNQEVVEGREVVYASRRTHEGDSLAKFKQLGRAITDILVQCVVLFKQSPLPGMLYLLFSYFLQILFLLNQHFQVIEKIQNVGVICIKKLLAADEKYHLHEFASEALYTLVSATLKAVVAYKETPGFMERAEQRQPESQQQQQVMKSNWIWSRSAVTL